MFSFSINTNYEDLSRELVLTKNQLDYACANQKNFRSDFQIQLFCMTIDALKIARGFSMESEMEASTISTTCHVCSGEMYDESEYLTVCFFINSYNS